MNIIKQFARRSVPGRVTLVIPPSEFLLDERVFPSLGILKVASVLEKAGAAVDVIDLSGIENFNDVIRDYCEGVVGGIFGITATTPQLPSACNVAEAIREYSDARIVLGGPHATLVAAAYKKEKKEGFIGRAHTAYATLEKYFDVIVAGDGEESIFLACESDAPRFIDADDRTSPLFLTDERLTDSPFPARHLIDLPSYHYKIDGARATSLIAQLGCPFYCGFCGGRASPMLRNIRKRTSESIVDEVSFLFKEYGYTGFMFYDDELNVNKKMVELMQLLAKAQKDLGTEWRLRGFIKAELFTDEQAQAMYEAGFRWLLTGFESGSPRILENINKRANQEDNTRCVEIARRHGLKVKALMSIGHPGESRETIADTKRWLLDTKPEDFDVSIITCYPGSPYYDEARPHAEKPGIWTYVYKETGDALHQVELDYAKVSDYYKGDPDGGYQAYVYTDYLSREDLVLLRNSLESEVRAYLGIPFNPAAVVVRYEHSMGQSGPRLPSRILRSTAAQSSTPA